MNKGQCQSVQFEGIPLSIIMSKYESNTLSNKKKLYKKYQKRIGKKQSLGI